MDDRHRQLAFLRFMEIEAELKALAKGRVVDGNPRPWKRSCYKMKMRIV